MDNVDLKVVETVENIDNSIPICANNKPVVVQNLNLSGTKNEPIEVQNLRPNNTELINNESNNINSIQINSKKNFKKEMELKGIENNRKSILEIKEEVLTEFNSEETLPYIYTDKSYHRHLKQAVQMLSGYYNYKREAADKNCSIEQNSYNEDNFTLVHTFSEALFKMLSTEGNQTINGQNVTYAKVYDELVNYVKFETIVNHNRGEVREEWLIRELMENAISCYKDASLLNKINYPIPYMMTCIWSAMENGNGKIHDHIRYDFGGY